MNKEMKRLFRKFLFSNAVVACGILLFCGSVTAAQRTAYNAYLREYAVLSMVNQGEKVKMKGFSREITFEKPKQAETEKLKRYLKLTPFACLVFFGESASEVMEEIVDNLLT